MRNIFISALFILVLIFSVPCVSADEGSIDYKTYRESWDILPADQNDWYCVQYSVNYARNNPGWKFLIISPSPDFRYHPHMLNYKIEGEILKIHDPTWGFSSDLEIVSEDMYVPHYLLDVENFDSRWTGPVYFYFTENESEIRQSFIRLSDNRDRYFDYENLTPNKEFTFSYYDYGRLDKYQPKNGKFERIVDNTKKDNTVVFENDNVDKAQETGNHTENTTDEYFDNAPTSFFQKVAIFLGAKLNL